MNKQMINIFSEKKIVLFLRPDGMGKTTFLKKIEKYFVEERKIPVLHLSFGERRYTYDFDIDCVVQSALTAYEAIYRIEKSESTEKLSEGERFARCIIGAKERTGKNCAILIDDYDFPLLDDSADDTAKAHFESVLSSLYGAINTHKSYIETAFITGSSYQNVLLKYAKPNDFTENSELSASFGLKEDDILQLTNGEREKAKKLIEWYGGYSFGNDEKNRICNAYSLFSALNTGIIRAYNLGTKRIEKGIENILLSSFDFSLLLHKNGIECSEEAFFSYDNRSISPLPYLYQAGFLAKTKNNTQFNTFSLFFPNKEVRDIFFTECSRRLTAIPTHDIKMWTIKALRALEADDLREFFTQVNMALKNTSRLRDALTTIFGLFSIYTDSYFYDGYFSVETQSYLHLIAFDLVSMENAADRLYSTTIASWIKKVKKTGALINAQNGVISYRTM